MEYSLHCPAAHGAYAAETEQRMDHAISELQAIFRYGTGDVEAVLHLMNRQGEASLIAGFQDISALCRCLEDAIARARYQESLCWSGTLLEACSAIRMHAGSLASPIFRPHYTRKSVEQYRKVKQG